MDKLRPKSEKKPAVLLVDDDDMLRQTLVKAFERRGHAVEQAKSVESAIEKCYIFQPQWLVLDLRMPGQLGTELIKPLKDRYQDSIKIVVLTGYGSITTAIQAMRLGAHNYLTKPTDVDSIIQSFAEQQEVNPTIVAEPLSLSDVEWEHIQKVLRDCDGNISHAAKRLGIHRRSLQRKLNRSNSDIGNLTNIDDN
jgi:two-component system response regulator RegA